MHPLIFDRLTLQWSDLTQRNPWNYQGSPYVPLAEPLRSFPVPGRMALEAANNVNVTLEGMTFPSFGAYYLAGAFGAIKILLIDPGSSALHHLLEISRFVADTSWHAGVDSYLCHDGTAEEPFYLDRILNKLFHSDQPIGLWCIGVAHVCSALLQHAGITCRFVSLDGGVGHSFLEAYLEEAGGWLMIEPDFGLMLRHEQKFLSASAVLELCKARQSQEIELFALGDRLYPKHDFYLSLGFSGQFTWQPEYMSDRSAVTDPYYRATVLERGFTNALRYWEYRLVQQPRPALDVFPLKKRAEISVVNRGPEAKRTPRVDKLSRERVLEVQQTFPFGDREKRAFDRSVSQLKFEAIDKLFAKYEADLPTAASGSELKYLDVGFWLWSQAHFVVEMGLDDSPPAQILDLGCGGGHFGFMCQALGHEVLGLDIDVPFYIDLCEAFALQRRTFRVDRNAYFPELEKKFDLIVALDICFNVIAKDKIDRVFYWSLGDWIGFLAEAANLLSENGRLYLQLNEQLLPSGEFGHYEDLIFALIEAGAIMVNRQRNRLIISRAMLEENFASGFSLRRGLTPAKAPLAILPAA